ncbi:hypothetical protein NLM24_02705 [Nocardia zapadnayensis]|uniref:hypothetical protein n=1 Tax=Nocardia rhamnosiphila TaxID=426716 RepID=UPI002245CF2F|nr:hypothetical protein [Nocardia zapadnayensis]MCX0269638.1 hypothetical protein [Nocardia zapadnayensis]
MADQASGGYHEQEMASVGADIAGVESSATLEASDAAEGRALLVQVDFGEQASLREVHETQSLVRSLLFDLVAYEASKIDLPQLRGVRMGPDGVLVDIRKELAKQGSSHGIALPHSGRAVGTVGEFLQLLDGWLTSAIRVSSSLSVNPWQEILNVVAVGAGSGALARATWIGLTNANAILDFVVRASAFKVERRVRLAELEAEALRQSNAIVQEIIQASSDSTVASRTIGTIEVFSSEVASRVRISEISAEEAETRRLDLLNLVRGSETQQE